MSLSRNQDESSLEKSSTSLNHSAESLSHVTDIFSNFLFIVVMFLLRKEKIFPEPPLFTFNASYTHMFGMREEVVT